jgi:hypothetical protein
MLLMHHSAFAKYLRRCCCWCRAWLLAARRLLLQGLAAWMCGCSEIAEVLCCFCCCCLLSDHRAWLLAARRLLLQGLAAWMCGCSEIAEVLCCCCFCCCCLLSDHRAWLLAARRLLLQITSRRPATRAIGSAANCKRTRRECSQVSREGRRHTLETVVKLVYSGCRMMHAEVPAVYMLMLVAPVIV